MTINRRWIVLIDLLKDRPHAQGAEIGVFEGDTSYRLMDALPTIEKLFCIDPFVHYPEQTATLNPNKAQFHEADFNYMEQTFHSASFEHVERSFINRMAPFADRYVLLKLFSVKAALTIKDASLDFVFIDGNHAYAYIKQDISTWLPKIKSGGLLSGHDYHVKGHKGAFGVTRAVNEIFKEDHEFKRHVWWHNVK